LSEAADLATVTVYGGDFKAGKSSYFFEKFSLKSYDRFLFDEVIPLGRLASLETVSLESDGRSTLSTVGRALVGDLIAGPFGAIILAGTAKGRNQVTFLATFDDNRQFLGATDSETFKSWTGYLLTRKRAQENNAATAAEKEAKKIAREAEEEAGKVARADALIARYIDEQKATASAVEPPKPTSERMQDFDARQGRLIQSHAAVPAFGKRKSF
jgi:hypothetical protein